MNVVTVFKRICILATILTLSVPLPAAMAKQQNRHQWRTKKPMVKVMTRNVYLGADIFKVVDAATNPVAGPLDVPMAVADVFATVQYTNFTDRAEAIADEILYASPDVVGLQEMETFYLQSPGDMVNRIAAEPGEEKVFIDFLQVLQDALAARGLKYDAFSVTNADVELPMLTGFIKIPGIIDPIPTFDDVRMVDHDVILVRHKHDTLDFFAKNYDDFLSLSLGGTTVDFERGYLMLDVEIKGTVYRFVNTHLEVRSGTESVFRLIQSAQMEELLDKLAQEDGTAPPVILVGDFNSSIEDEEGFGLHPVYGWLPYVPPYIQAAAAGYLDTWLLQKHPGDGFTSGFEETIDDPYDTLETRIDLIFLDPGALEVDRVHAKVVGDDPNDMTPPDDLRPYGLWPSDHAGVVSKITFEKRGSHRHKKR